MYVIENGKKTELTHRETYEQSPSSSSSPTDFPIIGPSCTSSLSNSAIAKSKQTWKWQRWLKWIGIFIVFAILFYWLCVSEKGKQGSKGFRTSKYRYYYSR